MISENVRRRAESLLWTGSSEPRNPASQTLGELAILIIVCLSVLAPGLYYTNTPQTRQELLLLVFYILIYVWLLMAGRVRLIRFHFLAVIAAGFSLSAVASIFYAGIVLRHELVYRDYFEILKAWLPFLFFAVGYEVELSEAGLQRLLNWLGYTTLVICLYAWAQYRMMAFTFVINPYFSGSEKHDKALLVYHRVYSTLSNPNVLGQFLTWMLPAFTLALLFQVGSRLRNSVIVIACTITLVLTGSRYGLLTAALGIAIVFYLAIYMRSRVTVLVGLLLLVATMAATFAIVQRNVTTISQRFQELRDPMQIESIRERLDHLWGDAADYFISSPWVGHGPNKQIFLDIYSDSEYLNVLKQYGVLGFIWYFAYYCWPIYQLTKGLKSSAQLSAEMESKLRTNRVMSCVGFIVLLTALVMNIGEFTFYNWELLGFIWLLVGLSVRATDVLGEMSSLTAAERRPATGSRSTLLRPTAFTASPPRTSY